MTGEIPGMRRARDELRRQLKEAGHKKPYIEKRVDDVTRRAEARIRAGKQPKPREGD